MSPMIVMTVHVLFLSLILKQFEIVVVVVIIWVDNQSLLQIVNPSVGLSHSQKSSSRRIIQPTKASKSMAHCWSA